MFNKCYLHIGHPKTGSGAIERSFRNHRNTLEKNGLYYPDGPWNHFLLGSATYEHPKPMRHYLSKQTSPEDYAKISKDYSSELARKALMSSAQNIMLSSESFFNLPPLNFSRLVEYSSKLASEVVVVCYVRHPASQAASAVQQNIKVGRNTLDEIDEYLDFSQKLIPKLRKIREIVGEKSLVLRPFESTLLSRGDVVADMLEVIGMGHLINEGFELRKYNESLSYEAVLLGDALNRLYPSMTRGRWNVERAPELDKLLARIGGRKFTLPAEKMEAAIKYSAPALKILEDEFGLVFFEPKTQTDTPSWNTETLQDIMREINSLMLENIELKKELAASSKK